MKNIFKKGIVGCLIAIVIFGLLYSVSWIVTCGIIKLITLCFGLEFSWSIATGIWLIMCLLWPMFSNHTTVKK